MAALFRFRKYTGQITATSHDLASNAGLVIYMPVFQGNLIPYRSNHRTSDDDWGV